MRIFALIDETNWYGLEVNENNLENKLKKFANPWVFRAVFFLGLQVTPALGQSFPVASMLYLLFGVFSPYAIMLFSVKSGIKNKLSSAFWLFYVISSYVFWKFYSDTPTYLLIGSIILLTPIVFTLFVEILHQTTREEKALLSSFIAPIFPILLVPSLSPITKVLAYLIVLTLIITIIGLYVSLNRATEDKKDWKEILRKRFIETLGNFLESIVELMKSSIVKLIQITYEFVFFLLLPILLIFIANFAVMSFDFIYYEYHLYDKYGNFVWILASIIMYFFFMRIAFSKKQSLKKLGKSTPLTANFSWLCCLCILL